MERRSERKKRGASRKKRTILALLLVSVSMIAAGVSVSAKSITKTTQNLETGVVNIELSAPTERFSGILPGQRVFFSPKIENKGYDCYVRASYAFSDFKDHLGTFRNTGSWVYSRKDGFWYSKDVLPTGSSLSVFDGFKVAEDLPNEAAGKKILLSVKAEAVQAANFTPDFDSEEPWGSVETEILGTKKAYSVDQSGIKEAGLSVTFEGEAGRLLAAPDDFFENFPTMMPGDTYEQSIVMSNQYELPTELFFYSLCEKEDEMADQVHLTITSSLTGMVYDGPLRASDIDGESRAVSLGEIPANAQGTLDFTLKVPAELKNEYVLRKSQVQWIFTTDKKAKSVSRQVGRGINTGDGNHFGIPLAILGTALLVLIFAANRKRFLVKKGKENDRKKNRVH